MSATLLEVNVRDGQARGIFVVAVLGAATVASGRSSGSRKVCGRTISTGVRAHVSTDETKMKVLGVSSSALDSVSIAFVAASISACGRSHPKQ